MLTQRRKALERVLGQAAPRASRGSHAPHHARFPDERHRFDLRCSTQHRQDRLRLGKDALRRHMERDAVLRVALGDNE